MDSPLLATSESHGSVGTETGVFYNLLERKDHQSIRLIFLLLSQFLFFILGAGLYVFPLWLNFIVTDNVSLSREALSLLGAVPFIGILGTGGGLILFVNWIQGISKTSKFILLTFTGASMIILAWGLLFLVIENTPEDKNNSNVVIIFSVLLLIGTAISIFFTTFLDKIFPLLKQKHHFIYGAFCNTGFALGSIFSLGELQRLFLSPVFFVFRFVRFYTTFPRFPRFPPLILVCLLQQAPSSS